MLCTKLKCIPKLLLVLNLASQTTSGFQCCLTNLTKIVSENPTNHCTFKTFNQLPIITNQDVFLQLHFKQNILQQTSKFTSLIIYFSLKFIPHSSHLNSDFVMYQLQYFLTNFLVQMSNHILHKWSSFLSSSQVEVTSAVPLFSCNLYRQE